MIKEQVLLFLFMIHLCCAEELFEAVTINTPTSQTYELSYNGFDTTSLSFQVPCCRLFSIYLTGYMNCSINTIHLEVCSAITCNSNLGIDNVEINGTTIYESEIACASETFLLSGTASGVIEFGVQSTGFVTNMPPFDQIDNVKIEVASDECTEWTFEKSTCSNGNYGEFCDLQCGHCLDVDCGRYTGFCPNGCKLGWDGMNCTEYIDPCFTACHNGGTCFDVSDMDPCTAAPCLNGGTCNKVAGTAVFSCTTLYSGPNCEQYTNPCAANPCLNEGTCNDIGGTAVCFCTSLYTGPWCEQLVDNGTQPVLLWPLDNTTYTTEILAHPNVSVDKSQCFMNFERPPPGYPNDVIMLDGTRPLDLTVDVPIGPVEDLSFSMLVKPQADTGTMMHFKPNDQTKNFREMLLYMNDGNLVMKRVLNNKTEVFNQTQTNVFVDSWYYMAYGIDGSKGTMILTVGDNVYELDDNFVDGIGIELPGVLRIGETFDQQQPNFVGSIACVGFFTNLTQPQRAEIEPLCKSVMWTPNTPDCNPTPLIERTDTTKGYFKKATGIQLTTLNKIGSSTQCTELRCSLSCLMHSGCWHYHFESSQTSCQECVLYDSTVRSWLGTGPVDEHLYKWVQK